MGDPDRARELLELVRADTDDPHTRALAAERIGALHLMYGDGEAGERAFAEALALVPEGETSVLAARIQGGLALLGVGWSRLDDAEFAGTEGLRIARAVGARREEGIALNALGTTAALRGDLGRAVDMLREALEIAREVEDPWDLGAAYVNLSHVLGMAGRLDECVELGRVGIVELTRFGQQRVQGSLLLNNVSEILVEAGRFDEAGALVVVGRLGAARPQVDLRGVSTHDRACHDDRGRSRTSSASRACSQRSQAAVRSPLTIAMSRGEPQHRRGPDAARVPASASATSSPASANRPASTRSSLTLFSSRLPCRAAGRPGSARRSRPGRARRTRRAGRPCRARG